MGAGAAQVETFERHAVLGPPGRRSEEEELIRRQLPVEDVPARQADHLLEVPRAEDLPVQDDLPQIRDVLLDRVEDRLSELLAPLFPRPLPQRVRRVLDET